MYIDACAIVAILGREDDAMTLTTRIGKATTPLFLSPTTVYEAVISLARNKADASGFNKQAVAAAMIEAAQVTVAQFEA